MSVFFKLCKEGGQGGKMRGQPGGAFSVMEAIPFPERGQQLRHHFGPNV